MGSLLAVRGHQEDPGVRQRGILIIESFMELDKFDHEAIVGTGDGPLLLHELFCLLVVIAQFEDYESDDDGD